MKDPNDNVTRDYFGCPIEPTPADSAGGGGQRSGHTAAGAAADKRKPRRLPQQVTSNTPEGAKPERRGEPLGFGRSVVPVSSVARDWGISARRVRSMLAEGRLSGRQLENGYWEVYYPYSYVLGTRGPAIKRQRDLPEKPPKKKPARMPEW